MENWLVKLDCALPASLVGRKAAALALLIESGFSVPPSVCITTSAYRAARTASSGELCLPAGMLEALSSMLPIDSPLVVRSSAVDEDMPDASLAGQYTTRLNVAGPAAFESAVLDCWRSYMNAEFTENDGGMGLLVQPLIDAECAGVCFTVDPVHLDPHTMLISSSWGLGLGVVSGSVPTDTVRLRRQDLQASQVSLGEKHTTVRPAAGGGVTWASTSGELVALPCLPESWLQQLGQHGLAIEQLFGIPQDIEWAVADQKLWILQSRPITALSDGIRQAVHFPIVWKDMEEPRHYWWLDRARAADSGPLLPAELDFVRINTKGAEDGIYYAGGAETRWRKEVNGRVYMTRAVPPHSAGHARVYRAAWQEMSERFSQQHFPAWEYWAPEVIAAARRLAAFDPRQADGQVLAEHLEDVLAAATRAWMIHILFGPRMIRSPALAQAYARIAGLQPRDVSPEVPFLLAGAETIQTRLVETLFDLACLVGNSPDEAKAIVLQKAQLSATSPGMAAFALTFERLMSEYGDRLCYGSMPGFPAQVPLPWRESPEHVWEMIRSYLPLAQQGGPGPRQLRLQARDAVGERVEALCAAAIENKIDPDVVQNFRGQLAFWRERAAGLDEHNHYIDQLSEGQFYQAFLYAGRWLAAQGILPGPFEIFWLHAPEVLAALRGFVHDLDSIIAERRLQFSDWQSLIAPPCLGLPDAHLPGRPEQLVAETVSRSDVNLPPNTLSGEPASRGHAHGRARLIAGDALPADIASGDIIVAPFAGPALIPLLPAIAAVVLDYGGPGDHFAITAREFGIPAVCSTVHATRRIPEGAQLTIDAGSGLVTWL